MSAREYNFDGLIGPTHNYSGLAIGNIASTDNRFSVSSPQKAALEGLAKMKLLHGLGVKQGFILPQERPSFRALRGLGFRGTDRQILEKVSRTKFPLLLAVSSASAMWTANAATVSPSIDTTDRRVHLTVANLISKQHRSIEPPETARFLKAIFKGRSFSHHPPLAGPGVSDEGAANHLRLAESYGKKGLEIFVYGRNRTRLKPKKFPARQSLKASEALSRRHKLPRQAVFFVQQNPKVIDTGVFHNDVIAVSNENVLLYHEEAFVDSRSFETELKEAFCTVANRALHLWKVSKHELPVKDAVTTYFFNSQIVTLPNNEMALIVPLECQRNPKTRKLIQNILSGNNPIRQARFVDLTQSMQNGGGPACLRLRVVVTPEEERGIDKNFVLNGARFTQLKSWVKRHYRNKLAIRDLADFSLVQESRAALDELTRLLRTGPIYDFQK